MSADHIFAAQMWLWADPMIKRDSHGRILVVNAAFLQLYGGTVENWTGNPIQGWPLPKSPGEISRFESRIPLATGGETVYDWMECTNQDGTSVAMARDVSAYAAIQAVEPQPIVEPQVQTEMAQMAEPTPQAQIPSHPDMGAQPVGATEYQAEAAPIAAELAAMAAQPLQSIQAQPVEEPAMAVAPAPAPVQPVTPVTAEPTLATPVATEIPPQSAAAPQIPVAEQQPFTPPQSEPSPVVAPLPVQNIPDVPVATENRDFERRALPIEDGDAILGNNWRDAVIAKAVGVEDAVDETPEVEAPEAPATAAKENGEQVKVLLAEDNAINALLTRTLLEAEGCQCDVVEDGVLAVEAVKNGQYDMIFMDMRMPNMDGLEATRKIRAMGHNAKALPIVALTANAFDDDRNACFDSGMNDFMTKPVSAEELSAMVKTHTGLAAEKIAS